MATQAMSDLTLNPTAAKPKSKTKKAAAPVADSWEDEDVDSEPEAEPASAEALSPTSPLDNDGSSKINTSGFTAPPPTPSSPTYGAPPWHPSLPSTAEASASSGSGSADPAAARRPEKTDAVARRMIASALGVRAPRPTDEQRAYDRAVREKEKKRREEEKEAERKRNEEVERAKAAIWDD